MNLLRFSFSVSPCFSWRIVPINLAIPHQSYMEYAWVPLVFSMWDSQLLQECEGRAKPHEPSFLCRLSCARAVCLNSPRQSRDRSLLLHSSDIVHEGEAKSPSPRHEQGALAELPSLYESYTLASSLPSTCASPCLTWLHSWRCSPILFRSKGESDVVLWIFCYPFSSHFKI